MTLRCRDLAVLFLVGVLGCGPAWSAGEWRLEKERDGIQIFSRHVEGWSIREFSGKTQVNARLSSVVAVLVDIDTNHELMKLPTTSSLYDRESDTRYRWYSKVDMPWPLTDRDILNQRQIEQNVETGAVTITDSAIQGVLPQKKGLVRIEQSTQIWVLTPMPGGTITAEVRILSDPAGPIPATFINAMSVDTPFGMLGKLKEIVKQEKFAQTRLSFIKEQDR